MTVGATNTKVLFSDSDKSLRIFCREILLLLGFLDFAILLNDPKLVVEIKGISCVSLSRENQLVILRLQYERVG